MPRAIAAVVAVVALAVGTIWLVRPRDGGGGGGDAKAWEAKAREAFKPLVDDVPDLVRGAREWQAGQRPQETFSAQVDKSVHDFFTTSEQLGRLRPSPKAKEAGELYKHSADLYVQVGSIYGVMVRTPPDDLRTQLDLLARRTRELADRVYDRGHAALAPYLNEQQSSDVEVRLPEEVPVWAAEGLAAGPPLDDPPAPRTESPPLRQASRPQQSESAWRREVNAAGIPPYGELSSALAPVLDRRLAAPVISGPERDRLRDIARRFIAAAELLRTKPDPKGGRERSAVLRLGLLVEADAARAGQAVTSPETGGLSRVAVGLADVGRHLLDEARR